MIDVEKLKKVKRLVTHASCPDGIASALIVKDALPDVEVTFMAHGTEEHRRLEPLPGTLFCDFTPPIARFMEDGRGSLTLDWISNGAIVLDHHPTQRDLTMAFVEAGLGAYGENDRNECGAWLAFKNIWLPLNNYESSDRADHVFNFAELAGVRDTWKKDDPRWQAACEQAEALMFWGLEKSIDEVFDVESEFYDIGGKLFEKKLESARKAIGESHRFATPKGTRVLMFQGVTPTSDAAEMLEKAESVIDDMRENILRPIHQGGRIFPIADEDKKLSDDLKKVRTDIVAGFHYKVDGTKLLLQFSTRSHTGYDVGAFCKSRGGGGHRAAAGFTVEQSPEVGANPYSVFRLILEEWEQGQ